MSKIVTPLKLQAWHDALSDYRDKTFAAYILWGIEMGFKIGFDTGLVNLKSQKGNLSTALEQPEVVEKYLHEELQANWVIKIHPSDDVKGLDIQCSPFGVIPKKNRHNKWRLIIDLLAPQSHSVNDGISKELATLSYVSVDDVVSGVLQRAMMAKMDIHHAYRNIPIHPSDRGRNVCGCNIAIWPEICALNFLHTSGYITIDHGKDGSPVGCPLY